MKHVARIAFALLLGALLVPSVARAAALTVGNVAASCGSTVTVPVSIDSVSGVMAIEFELRFDPAKLSSPTVVAGAAASGFSVASNPLSGAVRVAMASGSPVSGPGVIANVTFAVSSGAPSGTSAVSIATPLVNDVSATGVNGGVGITCGSSGAEMLLLGGRVGVSCSWRSQWTGKSGACTPVKQLDGYGYFWFESAEVPEAFVKVTDFTGSAYQVYHTALSDIEYTITFRVVASGRTYPFRRDAGSVCGLTDTRTVMK